MGKYRIKSGDQVMVIAGKEKGKKGKVLSVDPVAQRVLIEGVNQLKRHVKPTQQNPQGGIVMKETPVHASNVLLFDPNANKAVRTGRKKIEGKKKGETTRWVRYSKKSDFVFDKAGK